MRDENNRSSRTHPKDVTVAGWMKCRLRRSVASPVDSSDSSTLGQRWLDLSYQRNFLAGTNQLKGSSRVTRAGGSRRDWPRNLEVCARCTRRSASGRVLVPRLTRERLNGHRPVPVGESRLLSAQCEVSALFSRLVPMTKGQWAPRNMNRSYSEDQRIGKRLDDRSKLGRTSRASQSTVSSARAGCANMGCTRSNEQHICQRRRRPRERELDMPWRLRCFSGNSRLANGRRFAPSCSASRDEAETPHEKAIRSARSTTTGSSVRTG